MGEVYRARDAVLERPVAIKVLHRNLAGDAGFVERFRREARAAANLNHQNIVAVHDWGSVDGIYYMVMEYVAGLSVREILHAEGLLAPAQAADVLEQTLAALQHAHRQGIVHRDVKPENLMVTRDGVVKVADFGLARAFADAQITEAGNVTGTVQYLAPEQLQGEPADPRTDLYALGVVGFELLTGRLPFTGETPMAIAYKHIHEPMPKPSSMNPAVPASLDGWVASVTEKQRELRPESAAEARRDLEAEARSLPAAPPLASLVPEVTGDPGTGRRHVAIPEPRADPGRDRHDPRPRDRAFEAEAPQGPVGARRSCLALARDRRRGVGVVDLPDPARGRRAEGRRPHGRGRAGAARTTPGSSFGWRRAGTRPRSRRAAC